MEKDKASYKNFKKALNSPRRFHSDHIYEKMNTGKYLDISLIQFESVERGAITK